MLKKLNFMHFVALFWLSAGCVGLYFASIRFDKEITLRLYGKESIGSVVSISHQLKSVDSKGNRSVISGSDKVRLERSGHVHKSESTYELTYTFSDSSKKLFQGKTFSGFEFSHQVGGAIWVTYLPNNPKISEISSRIENTFGNNLFWVIFLIFWVLFILFPAVFMFKAGFPKKN